MALNMCRRWSNGIEIPFFSSPPKKYKKSSSGWGLRPQIPVSDAFEFTPLYSTRFPSLTFALFNYWFKPFFFTKSCLSAKHMPWLLIFHSTISLPHKKFLFWKLLMTSLRMICGLGPPIKNPSYAYDPYDGTTAGLMLSSSVNPFLPGQV